MLNHYLTADQVTKKRGRKMKKQLPTKFTILAILITVCKFSVN